MTPPAPKGQGRERGQGDTERCPGAPRPVQPAVPQVRRAGCEAGCFDKGVPIPLRECPMELPGSGTEGRPLRTVSTVGHLEVAFSLCRACQGSGTPPGVKLHVPCLLPWPQFSHTLVSEGTKPGGHLTGLQERKQLSPTPPQCPLEAGGSRPGSGPPPQVEEMLAFGELHGGGQFQVGQAHSEPLLLSSWGLQANHLPSLSLHLSEVPSWKVAEAQSEPDCKSG
jgi:hypothetical protein